jgi:hypothetical protein
MVRSRPFERRSPAQEVGGHLSKIGFVWHLTQKDLRARDRRDFDQVLAHYPR